MGAHELLDSRQVFSGKIFEVKVDRVRLPSGHQATREVVSHPGAVGIVAVDAGKVLLVRQHRHAVGGELLEIPAGKLDRPDEDPQGCARRELEEETGYAARMIPLASFYNSPGYSSERFHIFRAVDLQRVSDPPVTDEEEPLASEWVAWFDALEMVRDGRIRDAKTMIGLLLYADAGGSAG